MIDAIRRHKTLLVSIGAVLVPLVMYTAHARQPEAMTPLDQVVLVLASPLERGLSWTVSAVSSTWAGYVDVRGARAENAVLRRQVQVLERERDARAGLEAENARLRTLLGLAEGNPALQLLAARVIAESPSPLERSVRIDRGLQHGVRRGMPVICDRGLVGRVQRVGYGYAVVSLIADEKVSLDVVLGRSRVHGRLQGAGLWPVSRLDVLHVLRTEDVRIGDVVLTSGLAGVFPEDVPVALVSKVDSSPGGQELLIEVTPLVDFGRLEDVAVVVGPSRPGEPMITPEELLPVELQRTSTTSTATAAGGLVGPPRQPAPASPPAAGPARDGGPR